MLLNSSPEDAENKDPPAPEVSVRPYQDVPDLKLFEALDAYSGPIRLRVLWEMMKMPEPSIPLEAAIDEIRHRVHGLTGKNFRRLERKIQLAQEAAVHERRNLSRAAGTTRETLYQKIDGLADASETRWQSSGWDDPPAQKE